MAPNQFGDRVKRLFGIDPEDRINDQDKFDDGSFVEKEPTMKDVIEYIVPTLPGVQRYLRELFPFWNWIFHYNLTWLLGDIIAGECRRSDRVDPC